MATGAEVLANKVMWALGYHVPEYYLTHFRSEDLVLAPDARIEPPGYNERPHEAARHHLLLDRVEREPDGRFHVSASKDLPGTPGRAIPFSRHAPRRPQRRRAARAPP